VSRSTPCLRCESQEGFHGSHKTRLAGGLVTFPRSPSVLKGDRYFDRILFPTDPGEFDKAKGIYSATRLCFIIASAELKKWETHQRIVYNAFFLLLILIRIIPSWVCRRELPH
jgi:hypothetical protein